MNDTDNQNQVRLDTVQFTYQGSKLVVAWWPEVTMIQQVRTLNSS